MDSARGQRTVVEGILDGLAALRLHREEVWSLLDELDRTVPAPTGELRGPESTKRLAVVMASLAHRLEVSAMERCGRLQRRSVLPFAPFTPFALPSTEVVSDRPAEAMDSAAE